MTAPLREFIAIPAATTAMTSDTASSAPEGEALPLVSERSGMLQGFVPGDQRSAA